MMARKSSILFLLAVVCFLFTNTVASVHADEDIQKHASCAYCGMDREKFAHSRVLIDYEDGTQTGTCSIHCAAIDLSSNIDKTPGKIMVGDYGTRKLIDAEQATWVIGGDKPGVMTKRAKWAFENKGDAEKFVAEHGGDIASFDDIVKASYEDMYADSKMIREKRKMMKHKHQQQ